MNFNSPKIQTQVTPTESEIYDSPNGVMNSTDAPEISFVIPAMNEEDSLEELVSRIALHAGTDNYEIILIDDGSTDNTWEVIQALADLNPNQIRGIRFRSNCGKAAGLQAGFDLAEGDLVFTMDADLQDDPKEIPRFIEKINEGYDLVSGWKAVRHDPWHKVLPSRVFNRMLSYFSKVNLHDHNCGFKCYRREVAKSIKLFGELHRMVPSLAGMQGFKVTEIVVEHHARQFGASKYGVERFIRGFSDMLTMGFLRSYQERPAHFANACAQLYAVAAIGLLTLSIFSGVKTTSGIVTLSTGLIFIGMGGACVIAGLFVELVIRQNSPAQVHSIVGDTRPTTGRHPEQVESHEELDTARTSRSDSKRSLIGV